MWKKISGPYCGTSDSRMHMRECLPYPRSLTACAQGQLKKRELLEELQLKLFKKEMEVITLFLSGVAFTWRLLLLLPSKATLQSYL